MKPCYDNNDAGFFVERAYILIKKCFCVVYDYVVKADLSKGY